jgi:hypothetical protein
LLRELIRDPVFTQRNVVFASLFHCEKAVAVVLVLLVLRIKPTAFLIAGILVAGVLMIRGVVVAWALSSPISEKLVTTQYVIPVVPEGLQAPKIGQLRPRQITVFAPHAIIAQEGRASGAVGTIPPASR